MSPRLLGRAVSHADAHGRRGFTLFDPRFPHSLVRAACRPPGEETMTRTRRILDGRPDRDAGAGGCRAGGLGGAALGFAGAGVEPDLHRHAHRDEHGELLQPPAGGDRPHRDLRRVQRHRTPLHADLRPRAGSPRRLAPGGGHRGRVHRAGRLVPVPAGGARCPATRRRWRRWATTAQYDGQSVARGNRLGHPGGPGRARLARDGWLQRDATRRSPVGPRWASGGRRPRPSDP